MALILVGALGCPGSRGAPEPPAGEHVQPPKTTAATPPADRPVDRPELVRAEPEPPPLVYQDSNGSLQLTPIAAQLRGPGLELDDHDHIRGFQNRQQRAVWQAHITVPGRYEIEAETLCTGPTREAKMRVHVGENLFVEGISQLSDHSTQLVTTPLGTLELRAPQTYRVELEMTGLPLVGQFAVAGIRFVPLEAAASPAPRFNAETPDGD